MQKWHDKIKKWYTATPPAWTREMVEQAYKKGLLTEEEYKDIIGEGAK